MKIPKGKMAASIVGELFLIGQPPEEFQVKTSGVVGWLDAETGERVGWVREL
jgi:hypothetical protein